MITLIKVLCPADVIAPKEAALHDHTIIAKVDQYDAVIFYFLFDHTVKRNVS